MVLHQAQSWNSTLDGTTPLLVWMIVQMTLLVCSALSFDFPSKVYFYLTFPIAAMLIVLLVAVILSKTTVRFEGCKATMWLFTIIWVYTFGARILSDLFVLFPCFQGVDGDGAEEAMMLHDPDTSCYGHPVLMVLTPVGIAGYSFAAIYVLGIAFWGHKETIQHRGAATKHELEYTFKTFGFLFYGSNTNNSVTRCALYSRLASDSVSVSHTLCLLHPDLLCDFGWSKPEEMQAQITVLSDRRSDLDQLCIQLKASLEEARKCSIPVAAQIGILGCNRF